MFNHGRIRDLQDQLEKLQVRYQKAADEKVFAERAYENFLTLQKSVRDYIREANIPFYSYDILSQGHYILDIETNRIQTQRAQEAKEAEINALIKKALLDAGLIKPDKTKK